MKYFKFLFWTPKLLKKPPIVEIAKCSTGRILSVRLIKDKHGLWDLDMIINKDPIIGMPSDTLSRIFNF